MKILTDVILIGADPEVFLFHEPRKAFVSSVDLIGGSKHEPRQLEDGISVQEDNVLAEFNIPASKTKLEFIRGITGGLFQLSKILPEGVVPKIQTSAFMPNEELLHPRAIEFGCTPDFNAWLDGQENSKPFVPEDGLRTAGGHIHVGFEMSEWGKEMQLPKQEVAHEIVRMCDLYLGVPSIIMDRDIHRRKLYGKAGAFRLKEYGVEYRTLSSFWLRDVDHMDWAYSQTMRAVEAVSSGESVSKTVGDKVQRTINDSDSDLARELVKELDLVLL